VNGLERGLKDILKAVNEKGKHPFEIALESGFLKLERPTRAIDYFYAGWSLQCPRYIQAAMNAKLPQHPMLFRQRKAFEYGNSAHERYQNAIKAIDPSAIAENSIRFSIGTITISGKIDLITTLPGMIRAIIEFKTLNGTEFKTLNAPKREHLGQWTTYAQHMRLTDGLIIYENKDDSKSFGILPTLKIFEVKYDSSIFDKIIEDFTLVQNCNKEDKIAPRMFPCPNPYCEIKCKAEESK
jgi:hypothetical protein